MSTSDYTAPSQSSLSTREQCNEVLCKVLCHNLCCLVASIYELGIEPMFWTERERGGEAKRQERTA